MQKLSNQIWVKSIETMLRGIIPKKSRQIAQVGQRRIIRILQRRDTRVCIDLQAKNPGFQKEETRKERKKRGERKRRKKRKEERKRSKERASKRKENEKEKKAKKAAQQRVKRHPSCVKERSWRPVEVWRKWTPSGLVWPLTV